MDIPNSHSTDIFHADEDAFIIALIDAAADAIKNPILFIADSADKARYVYNKIKSCPACSTMRIEYRTRDLSRPDINNRDDTGVDIIIYSISNSFYCPVHMLQVMSDRRHNIWLYVDPHKTDYPTVGYLLNCVYQFPNHGEVAGLFGQQGDVCNIFIAPVHPIETSLIPLSEKAIAQTLQSRESATNLMYLIYDDPTTNETAQYWINCPRKTSRAGKESIIREAVRGDQYGPAFSKISVRCASLHSFLGIIIPYRLQCGNITIHIYSSLLQPFVQLPDHPLNKFIPDLSRLCAENYVVRLTCANQMVPQEQQI